MSGAGTTSLPSAPDDRVPGTGPAEVVRSEEQLRVRTVREPSGRVRVSKRVVTEERTVTVTVRREELVVERLPAASSGPKTGGGLDVSTHEAGPSGEPVLELVLHEEVVELVTTVRPRERVRVFRDTVTESVVVGEELGREVVEVATEPGTSPRRDRE